MILPKMEMPTQPYSAPTEPYGADLAWVHHEQFGLLALGAATVVLDALQTAGLRSGLVVDLGCGTGIMARALTDAGYDVLGVDASASMLTIARGHAPLAELWQGSLLDVEIPQCVAVTAIGECVNYRVGERAYDLAGMAAVRWLVARSAAALVPGGLLLFDTAGPGRAGPDRWQEVVNLADDWAMVMRAREERDLLTRDITLFRRYGEAYRRSNERHVLQLVSPDLVERVLADVGFQVRRLSGYAGAKTGPGWTAFQATQPRG
jgi:SAM-dependent methyltransferase